MISKLSHFTVSDKTTVYLIRKRAETYCETNHIINNENGLHSQDFITTGNISKFLDRLLYSTKPGFWIPPPTRLPQRWLTEVKTFRL